MWVYSTLTLPSQLRGHAVNIHHLEARSLQALDHNLGEPLHQLVTKVVILLALFPQTASVKGDQLHRSESTHIEMPPVRREEPRPAQRLPLIEGLDGTRLPT